MPDLFLKVESVFNYRSHGDIFGDRIEMFILLNSYFAKIYGDLGEILKYDISVRLCKD